MPAEIVLLAREPRPRPWRRPALLVLAVVLAVSGALLQTGAYASGAAGTVTGRVFEDVDRNGAYDPGEPAWSDVGMLLYPFDGSGVQSAVTGSDGAWAFTDLAAGRYRVRMSNLSWRPVQMDWVPTTQDSVFPDVVVDVDGGTITYDLGWRPIAWSSSLSDPMSTATGPDGLVVRSFTDAISASRVLGAFEEGTLRGQEANSTTVNFGYRPYESSYCATSVSGSAGSYSNFAANCYVSYQSWLVSSDNALFHEYGHAWANYHDKVVQQDGAYGGYLEARGLTGDSRLGTSHAWQPGEMIAEDFRQLFGSSTAAAHPQENQDIPVAADVPGLVDYLRTTFMTAPSPDPSATEEPSPDPSPTPEPSPEPEPEPEPVVTELRGWSESLRGGSWAAVVEGRVALSDGAPAADVLLALVYEVPGKRGTVQQVQVTCQTSSDGTCRVRVELSNKSSDVRFTVDTPSPSPGASSVVVAR